MPVEFNELAGDAIGEAHKKTLSDCFVCGDKYFPCGYSKNQYYNNPFAVAIAIIGKEYGSKNNHNSYYHKGIAFICGELNISKRQVKVLRKKIKVPKGYEFKTPYAIPEIIEKMISLLQDKEHEDLVKELVNTYKETLYRKLLIGIQYDEIKNTAADTKKQEISEVEGKLDKLTQHFGG